MSDSLHRHTGRVGRSIGVGSSSSWRSWRGKFETPLAPTIFRRPWTRDRAAGAEEQRGERGCRSEKTPGQQAVVPLESCRGRCATPVSENASLPPTCPNLAENAAVKFVMFVMFARLRKVGEAAEFKDLTGGGYKW